MTDEGEDRQPQVVRAAIRLGRSQRWAAFIIGLAAMGAGGVVSFTGHLESAPVALLVVGLLLALVGLSGVLPTRIRFQDNEVEFLEQRVATALKQGVDATPRASMELAGVVERVAEVAPRIAAPAQAVLEWQQLVYEMIQDAMLTLLPSGASLIYQNREAPTGSAAYRGPVIELQPSDSCDAINRRVLIDVRTEVRQLEQVARWASEARMFPNTSLLVITRQLASSVFPDFIQGVYYVQIRGREDADALASELQRAATGASLPGWSKIPSSPENAPAG